MEILVAFALFAVFTLPTLPAQQPLSATEPNCASQDDWLSSSDKESIFHLTSSP